MKPTFAQAPKAFAFFQTTMFSMFFKAIFFSYWNSLSASKDFRWLGVNTSNSKNTRALISAPESTIPRLYIGFSSQYRNMVLAAA